MPLTSSKEITHEKLGLVFDLVVDHFEVFVHYFPVYVLSAHDFVLQALILELHLLQLLHDWPLDLLKL